MSTTEQTGSGLANVPVSDVALNRKDLVAAEARWCPGCGNYAILAAFQSALLQLGLKRENIAIISGIGCSSRFPYYVNAYGMHSIHGRAPSFATGLATARPDLSVWVVTGDGDALAIGGNHFIHALRRNVNVTILLFNNRIYGMTKGQYSPTSGSGTRTPSSPAGSPDMPINPVSLALGAEATFVARALASDRAGLEEALMAGARHRGASLIEIYQNCPIFNDGSYDALSGAGGIHLVHGEPITWDDGRFCVVRDVNGTLVATETANVNSDQIVVHDIHNPDPAYAFGLAELTDTNAMSRAPLGIFRAVQRPTFDDLVRAGVRKPEERQAALQQWITGGDSWNIRCG